MKKFFTIALIALFCVSLAPAAYAATPGEWFQSQIASILSQIEQLQQQLNEMIGVQQATVAATLIDNRGVGAKNHKVLVVLLDYKNGYKDTDGYVKRVFQETSDANMREFSYGKLTVTFSVLDWYHLDGNYTGDRAGAPHEDVVKSLMANHVNLADYNRMIIVSSIPPRLSWC